MSPNRHLSVVTEQEPAASEAVPGSGDQIRFPGLMDLFLARREELVRDFMTAGHTGRTLTDGVPTNSPSRRHLEVAQSPTDK